MSTITNLLHRGRGLLALALVFLSPVALAQSSTSAGQLTLSQQDKSWTVFFAWLTGSSSPTAWDVSASPFGPVFQAFNSLVLMAGGLLAAYTIFGGILQTAHDGEVLGRKWSTSHLPLRVALGSSILIPVVNGFNIAQMLVIWIAMAGSAGANMVWSAFIGNFPSTLNQNIIVENSQGTQRAVVDMARSWVCVYSLNWHSGAGLQPNPVSEATTDISSTSDPYTELSGQTPEQYVVHYGVNTTNTNANHAVGNYPCGSAAIRIAPTTIGSSTTIVGSSPVMQSFNTMMQSAQQSATQADIQAFQQLDQQAQTIARAYYQSVYGSGSPDPTNAGTGTTTASQLVTDAQTYDQAVSQAMSSAAASSGTNLVTALKAQMGQDGWFTAGTWYMQLASLQNAYNSMARNVPTTGGLQYHGIGGEVGEQVKADVDMFNLYLSNAGEASGLTANAVPPPTAAGGSGAGDSDMGILQRIESLLNPATLMEKAADLWNSVVNRIQQFEDNCTKDIINAISSTNADPIMTMQGVGSIIMGVGDMMLALDATFGYPVSKPIADMMSAMTLGLLSGGLMLELFLPMTPYLIWVGTVLGWMILVLEALIGASLWALAHLHPDADGIVGRGGQGYGLLTALALRPALMVLGLVFAMTLIYPAAAFVNSTFIAAYESVIGNFHNGPFVFVAVIILYCTLMMTVVKKTFSLIWFVPDNVLRWFDGPLAGMLGDSGQEIAGAAGGAARSAMNKGTMGATAMVHERDAKRRAERRKEGEGGGDGDKGGGGGSSGGKRYNLAPHLRDPEADRNSNIAPERGAPGTGSLADARARAAAKQGGKGSNGEGDASPGAASSPGAAGGPSGGSQREAWSDAAFAYEGDQVLLRVTGTNPPPPGTPVMATKKEGDKSEVIAGPLVFQRDGHSYLRFRNP